MTTAGLNGGDLSGTGGRHEFAGLTRADVVEWAGADHRQAGDARAGGQHEITDAGQRAGARGRHPLSHR